MIIMRYSINIAVLFLFVTGLSCTDRYFDTSDICTSILKYEIVSVVDQNGEPVTGAELTVINKRNGKKFCINDDGTVRESCAMNLGAADFLPEGLYAVITSNNVGPDSPEDVRHNDVIRATFEKSGVSVSADYIVDTGRGKCHPEGLFGPKVIEMALPED